MELAGRVAQDLPLGSGVLPDARVVFVPPGIFGAMVRHAGSGSAGAGSSAALTVVAVPANVRWWLYGLNIRRDSGDNTFGTIQLSYPVGYGNGSIVLDDVTGLGATRYHWPNGGTGTTLLRPLGPLLLEPETALLVVMGGVGAAVTVIAAELLVWETPVRLPVGPRND